MAGVVGERYSCSNTMNTASLGDAEPAIDCLALPGTYGVIMTGRNVQPKVISSHDGPTYRVGGQLVTCIARASDTNGVYSLFETHTAPGQGTGLYRQQYEDESFWVLEGTYSFVVSSEQFMLAAGSYMYVPRRTRHGYANSGDGLARMLVLATPGAVCERFIAEAGARATGQDSSGQPGEQVDVSRLLSVAQKYGIEILPSDTPTDRSS